MPGDINRDGIASTHDSPPSGRFVLRLAPSLHEQLRREAKDAGVSLNDLCVKKLRALSLDLPDEISDLVARVKETFGENVHGVILYGSWARGESTPSSDIDVMVVLDPRVPLNMQLYEGWNEQEWKVDTHALDVHFAHIPDAGKLPSGLWAEIALDGKVVYESDLVVTRTLAGVRRRIAAGDLIRLSSHGQPYWVEGQTSAQR